MSKITPEMLVLAYSQGVFPMAHCRSGAVDWYTADPRAILPLESFHVPSSLRRRVNQRRFSITFDQAFEQVIRACAQPRPNASDTWINDEIIDAYTQLHQRGKAHSVEAWLSTSERDEQSRHLVGGLYGVALGGAFFGESMFHRATDASKVCLVHLVEHLCDRGYTLLDTQFSNPHLVQFGLKEISREEYLKMLASAIELSVSWESPNC